MSNYLRFQVHPDTNHPGKFVILDTHEGIVVSDDIPYYTASFRSGEYECGTLSPDQHFIH